MQQATPKAQENLARGTQLNFKGFETLTIRHSDSSCSKSQQRILRQNYVEDLLYDMRNPLSNSSVSTLSPPLESDDREEGDEDRHIETEDNRHADLDERVDGNIEADEETAAEGENDADESTQDFAVGRNQKRYLYHY